MISAARLLYWLLITAPERFAGWRMRFMGRLEKAMHSRPEPRRPAVFTLNTLVPGPGEAQLMPRRQDQPAVVIHLHSPTPEMFRDPEFRRALMEFTERCMDARRRAEPAPEVILGF